MPVYAHAGSCVRSTALICMCPCRFMRSLNSLASLSSAEGGGMRALDSTC